MQCGVFQVRAALPPIPRETAHALLELWIETGMMTVASQRPESGMHRTQIPGIADRDGRLPDASLLRRRPSVPPPWQPPVEARFHMEGAHLVQPFPPLCEEQETAVIVAHQSHDPFLDCGRDMGERRFPVL